MEKVLMRGRVPEMGFRPSLKISGGVRVRVRVRVRLRVERTRPQLLSGARAEVAEYGDEEELARDLDHLPPPAAGLVPG